MAFLNETGLSHLWEHILSKIGDKIAAAASSITPKAAGTASAGTETTFARGDHVHPAQTTVSGNAGSATKLQTPKAIDGVPFNGTTNITHYGTCSTAAATTIKIVSLNGFTLETGAKVAVKFTVTNTASDPKLNVNSTGAKAIYYRGSAISAGYLAANRVYQFVYDGTNYELIGDINTNTDTKVTQTVTTSNGNYPLLLAPKGQTATATTTSYFDSGVTLNPSTNTIAANISGNAASATNINMTLTNPSSNGTYAIPFHYGVSNGAKSLRTNDGLAYLTLEGTESAYGYGAIRTGNSTALGTAGNKQGRIYMYGKDAGYTLIVPGNNTSNNNIVTLPSSEGVIALTKDVLPLSGGTLTGKLTVPTITISSTSAEEHIQFSREGNNYILCPTNGVIAINCYNSCASSNSSLIISKAELRPGTTNTINLGTKDFKWGNVYASTFNGNATSANKVNSSLSIQLNSGTTTTFDGSAAVSIDITPAKIGAAASSHTHSYLPLGGGIMTGKITGVATQTTWIGTTRNGAFRVETAASGTKAVSALSMKTSSGAWSISNLANDDKLYFAYGTDIDYNANNNAVNNYSISTDGAWSGSAAKLTTARTLTIGSKGKTFDGSKNVSWTLAEIGAAASDHTHSEYADSGHTHNDYLKLSGGALSGQLTLGTDTTNIVPLKFNRSTFNYILVDEGASLVVNCKNTNTTTTASLFISGSSVCPGTDNTNTPISLGTNKNKWSSVYATNLYGKLTGGATMTTEVMVKNSNQTPMIKFAPTVLASGSSAFIFVDAGSTTGFTKNQLKFRVYSPTSSGGTTLTGKYEEFYLPPCDIGRTKDHGIYHILTSKSTVSVAQGGTGLTASPSMLVNLSSTTAAKVFQASPCPGITGTLGVPNGGTGANNAAGARTNLGITSGTSLLNAPSNPQAGDIFFLYNA